MDDRLKFTSPPIEIDIHAHSATFTMITDIADIVDLARYPIAESETSAAVALIRTGRARLAADGVFTLPGFIRPAGLAAMQDEAERLCPEAFRRVDHRNGFPSGMGKSTRLSLGCVGFDQMQAESAMRRLFLWDGLTRFVSEVLERRPFYRSADPIASCLVTEFARGDELGWHFDPNDGVVTLMLRSAGTGGAFEYVPNVRHRDDLPAIIENALAGECGELRQLDVKPGTLTLFNGYRSMHRVAPVSASPSRRMLTLSYDAAPGQHFSEEIHLRFFGRRRPVAAAPVPDDLPSSSSSRCVHASSSSTAARS